MHVSDKTLHSLSFEWTEPKNRSLHENIAYHLKLENTKGKEREPIKTADTKVVVTDLLPSTEYKVSLWAENDAGCGEVLTMQQFVHTNPLGMYLNIYNSDLIDGLKGAERI